MADSFFSKNRIVVLALAGVIVLAVISAVAFYAGKYSTSPVATQAPQAARMVAANRPGLVRLPPQHFGDWTLACARGPQGNKGCALMLIAVDNTRKHTLLRLSVIQSKKGPMIVALTPPSALISEGFTLTPDKGQAITAPFLRCVPGACQAAVAMTDAIASSLKEAAGAQVRFVAGTGRPVTFHIPTLGFSQGYAAWQAETPKLDSGENKAAAPTSKMGSASNATDSASPPAHDQKQN